jgi:hypothetical protein
MAQSAVLAKPESEKGRNCAVKRRQQGRREG